MKKSEGVRKKNEGGTMGGQEGLRKNCQVSSGESAKGDPFGGNLPKKVLAEVVESVWWGRGLVARQEGMAKGEGKVGPGRLSCRRMFADRPERGKERTIGSLGVW